MEGETQGPQPGEASQEGTREKFVIPDVPDTKVPLEIENVLAGEPGPDQSLEAVDQAPQFTPEQAQAAMDRLDQMISGTSDKLLKVALDEGRRYVGKFLA